MATSKLTSPWSFVSLSSSWEEFGVCLSPRNCPNYTFKFNNPFLSTLNIFFFSVLTTLFSLWGPPHPTLWQEELEFAAMRIEALKLARQIALSSLRSKVPGVCLPCVCECAQPGEPSAACPGAPWGDTRSMLAAELTQKRWHPPHSHPN